MELVCHQQHFLPVAADDYHQLLVGCDSANHLEGSLSARCAGIGLFFSVFMLGLTWLQARYTPFSPSNSEEFTSASRSVKPGLIASGIVSAWTWAATLVCTAERCPSPAT